MLNNVIFILRLAGHYGVRVFLPLCDLKYEHVISVCILWAVCWGVDMNFCLALCWCFFFSAICSAMISGYVMFPCSMLYCSIGSFSCYFACSYRPVLNYRFVINISVYCCMLELVLLNADFCGHGEELSGILSPGDFLISQVSTFEGSTL
jgi:hypothetical protein